MSEKEELSNKDSEIDDYENINYNFKNFLNEPKTTKNSYLINGSLFDKSNSIKKSSFTSLHHSIIPFKNSEKTIKKKLLKQNNPINLSKSNGEIRKNKNFEFKKNEKNNLFLISYKEKSFDRPSPISQTLKNVNLFYKNNNLYNNEQVTNEYDNKINIYNKNRNVNKSKTIKQIKFLSIKKKPKDNQFINFFRPDYEKNIDKIIEKEKNNDGIFTPKNISRVSRYSFATMELKPENNIFKKKSFKHYNTKKTFNFPQIANQNQQIPEKTSFTKYMDSFLYKSVTSKDNINMSNSPINSEKYSFHKRSEKLNLSQRFRQKKAVNQHNNKSPSLFSRLQRKKTFNESYINLKFKSNLNSRKKFNIYKFKVKKNKFLNFFKEQIKDKDKKTEKESKEKEEIKSSNEFIKNKINNWMLESPLKNIFENEEKLIYKNFENKKYKKKEKKYIKEIVINFIKRICSTSDISYYYLNYHKGKIEKDILRHIRDKFFDIILPSCLFENGDNELSLNKPQKNILRSMLVRKKTSNFKKNKWLLKKYNNNHPFMNSDIKKKSRRLSTVEQLRKGPLFNDFIPPLDETEKRHIFYLYFFDLDLEGNENLIIDDEKNSFLKLLRGDINIKEIDELLINKFITNYVKKNGTKNKDLSYNKKVSIKKNPISSKNVNDPSKGQKQSLFKNNFFSRLEIKRSNYKGENIKRKKSLLEYNLLFDPNLAGYNNLIADPKIEFHPNSETNIINKSKIKEIQDLRKRQIKTLLSSSGGMKTDKNIYVMKTLDLKNQYNSKNKGNINSLISNIKDCNYESFSKFYRTCNCGPNAVDKEGNSLLSLAVKSSCLEIVNFLLNEKANPNIQNVSIYFIFNIYFNF